MTAPVEYTTEPCRSCRKPVIWCLTTNANPMPVDADISPDGDIALDPIDGSQPLARRLSAAQRFGRTNLRLSHFATCPQAGQWRRRKTRTP